MMGSLWAEEVGQDLPTIGKQLPTFPYRVWGVNCRPPRWEVSVLPLRHRGP